MTDAPKPAPKNEDDKAAYLKAQKQRNLFIALGLVLFVVLVFFISMSRMASGLKRDAHLRAVAAESAAAADASKASQ
ncbi:MULTISPECIES: hypothetical protein [Asticcacaulis]|uniref:hypothetical protein n=1 Tax=Asticcacaulis TaxID=76890 RepID=UPI001AE92079|nr:MULTISPECIES: hypothetical protein [Asticcacaulis]MBP2158952.1 cell division septal protein FtsQ [Asticcacaulis solisilvae]MDR6799997.1 cell division septal protein FtsQ [Asticcacaulis sp. BE141]